MNDATGSRKRQLEGQRMATERTATVAGATPGGEAESSPRLDRYKWTVLGNTTIGILIATINSSILLISLPAIFRGIGSNPLSPEQSTCLRWSLLGYLVVAATLFVSVARTSARYRLVKLY